MHRNKGHRKNYDNLTKNAKTLKYKFKETKRLNAYLKLISKKDIVDIAHIKIDKNLPPGIHQF